MQTSPGDYSGRENLETMSAAVRYNGWLTKLVARHAGSCRRLLDFGAGNGTFAANLAALGYDVLAVEPDAALRSAIAARGIAVVEALASVPPASFAFAYTLNVLEHIDDDDSVMRALHATLRPGGVLLVYVPALPLLMTSMDRAVGHVRRYRRAELRTKLAAAGFEPVRLRYADSLGFFATLAFKAADPGDGRIRLRPLILYDRAVFPLSRRLDAITGRWFGKNLYAVARKPL
jgi:SAM-dependent methyltransferase